MIHEAFFWLGVAVFAAGGVLGVIFLGLVIFIKTAQYLRHWNGLLRGYQLYVQEQREEQRHSGG